LPPYLIIRFKVLEVNSESAPPEFVGFVGFIEFVEFVEFIGSPSGSRRGMWTFVIWDMWSVVDVSSSSSSQLLFQIYPLFLPDFF